MRRAHIFAALGAAAAFGVAAPAQACTVTTSLTTDLGSFSPAAVKNAVVPAAYSKAGLTCTPSLIVLLGGNYIKAKFHSANNLKLVNGASQISYVPSPDAAATVTWTQDQTVDYMQNNLLNVLGLLGGSSAEFPLYVKPSSATAMPVGDYTDRITITWSWYICQGLGIGPLCAGTPDQNTGTPTTTIDVTLHVTAKTITLTTTTSTTWDPVNGTSFPKSLPLGRKRMTISAANPDLVAADLNSIGLNVAVPARTMIALDGDGSSSTFLQYTDGTPASSLALIYTSPSSTSDDVDFSSDNGVSWTYYPVAGSDVSQAAVTNVRLRPRGSMAANSNFSVSLPLKTK